MYEPAATTGEQRLDNVIDLNSARSAADSAVRAEETALLLRVRERADHAAFAQLFTRFAPKLKHYLARLGCDHAHGESIVQDVMIAVWTKAALFDADKASARTWIYTLVRNRMIDLRRAAAREASAFEQYGHEQASADGGGEFSRAASVQVAGFLEELPPEQARILLMAYVEGRSHREIARALRIPIGTVKSRARLAFQRLRKRLETPL